MKGIPSRIVITITMLVLAFASPCYAQVKDDSQEPKTAPVNIVILKVTGPEDSRARASVIEGGSLKIKDVKSGITYAFFPVVDKKNKKNVMIKICNVVTDDSPERFDEVERMEISLGTSSKSLTTVPQFDIEVQAIERRILDGQPSQGPKKPDNMAIKSKPE